MAEARRPVPMGSLLHPLYGTAAQDIRAAVGASSGARMVDLHRRLDGLRRAVVLQSREFRGLWLKDAQDRVTPDHQKFIEVVCPDGSIRWERGESPHQLQACVDPEALGIEPGCVDAFRRVVSGEDELDAEGCDTLELVAGCGLTIQKTGPKELTLGAPGVQEVKVNGTSCESECTTVDLADSCSICWDIDTSGPDAPCVIKARLKWDLMPQPLFGEQVQVRICGCDGFDLVLSGFLMPSTG